MIRAAVQWRRGEFALSASFETRSRVVGVFGPSGAGKSTLIHLIAGLERPDRGTLAVGGEVMFDSERGVCVPAHRRHIAVVFQEHRLLPHLSVRGNLLYGAGKHAPEFDQTVDTLELRSVLERRIRSLSGGERQRVAIGRALLSRPRALLLDEPLASLDRRLKQQILPHLRKLVDATGIPVLYVSHDPSEILQLTDELIVLDAGRVSGHGRFAEVMFEEAASKILREGGAINVFPCVISSQRASDGVTEVRVGSGGGRPAAELSVPWVEGAPGRDLHLAIAPQDVALAIGPIEGISIQNQLRGVVRRVSPGPQHVLVELDVGTPLIVEISRSAASGLRVEAGRELTALIKSQSIRVL